MVAGKTDEAAGVTRYKDNAASGLICPEKPSCSLFTEGTISILSLPIITGEIF